MDIIGARRGLCGTLFAITDGKLAESASKKERERERERGRESGILGPLRRRHLTDVHVFDHIAFVSFDK